MQEEALKTTKLAVLMAERARNEARGLARVPERESDQHDHHLGRIIFMLFLVLAFGIGVGLYALIGPATAKIPIGEIKKVEPIQSATTIAVGNSSPEELRGAIAALFNTTTLPEGGERRVEFTTTDAGGKVVAAPTTAVLSALGTTAPPQALLSSLDTTLTYGIYSTGALVGFFKLHSRSYPETFGGMLKWEPAMAGALIPFLNPNMKKSDATLIRGRSFKDERVGGTNARVLSDPDGVVAIAYAFPDQETLIIAGGREALKELIEKSGTVR
jgi:hypothetical protein